MDGSWISSFFNSFGIYNKCSVAHRRDFHRAKVAVGICFEPTINRNEFRGATNIQASNINHQNIFLLSLVSSEPHVLQGGLRNYVFV